MNPEKGALTSVLFNSTTPKLQRIESFSTNYLLVDPIFTTSPENFALPLTLASDYEVDFNLIMGL